MHTTIKIRTGPLRQAIENLINVKLHDVLAYRNGLERLAAHRCTGVASPAIRQAETQLDIELAAIIPRQSHPHVRAEPRCNQ